MALKVGDEVRQKVPVITGPIVDIEYDKDAGALRYLVDWTDGEGETHQRWFGEAEIEAVVAEKGGK